MQPIEDATKRAFRVIVAGGGIAGLTLSNALQRAGIDHVVLEKHRQIVFPSGASIGIWPHGSRLLEQLGCLQLVQQECSKMTVSYSRQSEGRAIVTSKLFDEIEKNHGHEFLLLERQEFLRALYRGLPSKEPIRTGCSVKNIVESDNGVRVYLEDGSYEDGDIVVGCDGVASAVRQIMWNNANKDLPNSISAKEMTSYAAHYKCLVGLSPPITGFPAGAMTVVHHDRFSFLLFTQPLKTFFFVFIKLEQSFNWPDMPRYTQTDIEEEAAKLLDLPINENVKFGDIWNQRLRGDLVNIEEGILNHWHAGRIVLVGDAAHKMTPNVAFGGNSAMESAVVLANVLHARLMSSGTGLHSHPSQAELTDLFARYQKQRMSRVKHISWLSKFITSVHACENAVFKFIALSCFPWASDGMVAWIFAQHVKKGVKLDYAPMGSTKGKMPWPEEVERVRRSGTRTYLLLLGVILLASWTFVSSINHS